MGSGLVGFDKAQKTRLTNEAGFQFGCGGPQPTILAVDGTEDSKNANKI
jgi:hypothetical protein